VLAVREAAGIMGCRLGNRDRIRVPGPLPLFCDEVFYSMGAGDNGECQQGVTWGQEALSSAMA